MLDGQWLGLADWQVVVSGWVECRYVEMGVVSGGWGLTGQSRTC